VDPWQGGWGYFASGSWDANEKLWAYDGDTGAKLFAGGLESDALGGTM